jgi:hypothetical protein
MAQPVLLSRILEFGTYELSIRKAMPIPWELGEVNCQFYQFRSGPGAPKPFAIFQWCVMTIFMGLTVK